MVCWSVLSKLLFIATTKRLKPRQQSLIHFSIGRWWVTFSIKMYLYISQARMLVLMWMQSSQPRKQRRGSTNVNDRKDLSFTSQEHSRPDIAGHITIGYTYLFFNPTDDSLQSLSAYICGQIRLITLRMNLLIGTIRAFHTQTLRRTHDNKAKDALSVSIKHLNTYLPDIMSHNGSCCITG